MYSVEQVAERLGLHVRTVRAYLRTGRLKGVRIGKQYRVSEAALASLMGETSNRVAQPVRRQRHVDVSSIVQVDAISPEAVSRVTNMLMAMAKAPRDEDHPLRIDTSYDEEVARLKVFISGSAMTTVGFIRTVAMLVERQEHPSANDAAEDR